MYCCHNCFGDLGLKKEIIPLRSERNGECDYCKTKDEKLIEPNLLSEYFELLISVYEESDEGETLVTLLKGDWLLFDHPSMDDAHAKELLADILDDGEIVRKSFLPLTIDQEDNINIWEEFKLELMHQNRFFPKTPLDKFRLEELLSRLIADEEELPEKWYRARLHQGDADFKLKDMGAPPERKASNGRANPSGIPYLYLGSTHKTAISEVRPHPGESASLAEFNIMDSLKIVDLRNPRKLVSPFLLEDESEVALLRKDVIFLERLGKELTTPVLPTSAAIDYLPSQYLCEFIKKCGYHGVIYGSSVSDGINLALFQPENAEALSVNNYIVSSVSVEFQ